MKKLSVIVPVYNSEKYLRGCIESILAQTYSNLEIIIIDDGSVDGSLEIAREMRKKDDRIMVISQKNAGVSAARNAGLEVVSGEYIAFVDSDDFIEPGMYEKMSLAMQEHESDIVICGYRRIYEKGGQVYDTEEVSFPDTRWDSASSFMGDFGRLYSILLIHNIWNKLYRTDIIRGNGIRFDTDKKIGEDLTFNLQYLRQSDRILFAGFCLYRYFVRNNASLTKKFRENEYALKSELWNTVYDFVGSRPCFGANKVYLEKEFFKLSNECMENISLAKGLSYKKKREMCREILDELLTKGFLDRVDCTRRQERSLRGLYRKRRLGTVMVYFWTKNFLRRNCYWVFLRVR